MKYKITKKLIFYFTIVVLLFSLVSGILFITIFSAHIMKVNQEDLELRAKNVAEQLTIYEQNGLRGIDRKEGGFGAFVHFLDVIAMSEVWLLDKDADLIQVGHAKMVISYNQLPKDAKEVIQKVFEGESVYSKKFSDTLGSASVTAGAPVYNADNEVIAAVLLHNPVKGIDNALKDGIFIMISCMVVALIIAVLLSVRLSIHFIKPLKRMESTAGYLTEGDYTVQTGIDQKDEVGSLAHKLDILAERLRAASLESARLEQLRRDFISNISHELRTPVTVIRGSLEVLNDEVVTEPAQVKEYYTQMLGDALYLERLITDLLELSRLQNMEFSMEMTELNFIDVLMDAMRSFRMAAREKNIILVLETDFEEISFIGDYGRLRQMFMVVLDNAIKFSKEGGRIDVHADSREISIIDYGQGILEQHLPFIFDRFYHVPSEQNKLGTGLGLAIAKQIAKRHNIEVTCESEIEVKTKFQFKIHS